MKLLHTPETVGGTSEHWKRLSLGAGVSVATEDILGIFDMDTATVSAVTKKFLNTAQKNGCVSVVGEELPKSFVVVSRPVRLAPGTHGDTAEQQEKAHETQVALSQFAPSTLCGRDGSI
jgi:hypothetical protein